MQTSLKLCLMGRSSNSIILMALTVIFVLMFVVAISVGSVSIPLHEVVKILMGKESSDQAWKVIVESVRLPRSITASFAGMALGLAGLQMQALFRNPLADPFVLGISSGASFGVAIVVLAGGSAGALFASGLGWAGHLSLSVGAIIGAGIVLTTILILSNQVSSTVSILIIGLMTGFLVTSVVTIMLAFSDERQVNQFIIWGFGSFRGVTWSELRVMVPIIAVGVLFVWATTKQLNVLLLGESYAATMGVNVKLTRLLIVISASVLTGVVTAFTGPIGFLGIAVPHVARMLLSTSDHRILVPSVILIGASLALASEIVAQIPGRPYVLPLNAVTALIGTPIVVGVIVRSRRGIITS